MTSSGATIWDVGPSDAAPDWSDDDHGVPSVMIDTTDGAGALPHVQPGPLDASGGFRAHRLTLVFDVRGGVDAELALDFSSDRGPCPDIEIAVDGRFRGIFHPAVERHDRSVTAEPGPVAGPARIGARIPAAWLGPGPHRIDVTTVLDATAALGDRPDVSRRLSCVPAGRLPAARAHYGDWFGAYIRWTRARLVECEPTLPATRVTLHPTPFFVDVDGREAELIDCDIVWDAGAPAPDDVTIDWNGTILEVPAVPKDRDFGMFRWRFAAPPFDTPVHVRVRRGSAVTEHRIVACRKWTLHLIPHVHLDLGFTDAQGKVLELHCRNIDRAIDTMANDARFRFAVDGSVIVQEYLRTRPPERINRMLDAVARGALGVNAFHSNALTGLMSLEELHRSLDFGAGLPSPEATRYANLTDVPTHTRAVASVLAERGIDRFVAMSNHHRAATDTSDDLHLASPVQWEGPDGRRVLAHFADHYSQLRFIAADPQSVSGATNGLGRYLARYERADYLPADLALIGTHADNEDFADGDVGFVDRWNAAFAWPRIRLSTFGEYLDAVAPLRDSLPVWRSDSGSFWEDGAGSAAAGTARYRRAQAALPAAETLGALVAAASGLRTNRSEFDRAWAALSVAGEHTFTWARATSHPHGFPVRDQLEWKNRYIDDAHRVAIDETRRHLAQLAEVAGVTGPGVLAYNPHAWTADLDAEFDLATGADVFDADGTVPVEVLSDCAGLRRVRARLCRMPAHSWRFLPMSTGLRTAPGGDNAPPRQRSAMPEDGFRDPTARSFRTTTWAVELDEKTALPLTLRHRSSGRQLLDPSATARLGQVIRAATAPFDDAAARALARPPDRHEHRRRLTPQIDGFRPAHDGASSVISVDSPQLRFVGAKPTFDGTRLRWSGGGHGIDHLVIELLLRDDDSCTLDVQFEKAPCLDMEAIYIAFPFAGTNPVVRYDRPLGWVTPAADHGAGASNEWATLADTVSVHSAEGEIVWTAHDAPLFTVGDIVRGAWPTRFPSERSTIFSYVMNNFWPCNTPPTQSGPVAFTYRFGVQDAFDPARSSTFGRTARLDALVSEILPLERFEANAAATYREGTLAPAGDAGVDVHLFERDRARAELRVVNLTDRPLATEVLLPAAFVPDEDGPAGARHAAVATLPAYGTARIALRRR